MLCALDSCNASLGIRANSSSSLGSSDPGRERRTMRSSAPAVALQYKALCTAATRYADPLSVRRPLPASRFSPSPRHQLCRRQPPPATRKAPHPLAGPRRVVLLPIRRVDRLQQTLTTWRAHPNRNLSIANLHGAPRLVEECTMPTAGLVVPRSHEHPAVHHHCPDPNETMVVHARANPQDLALIHRRDRRLGELTPLHRSLPSCDSLRAGDGHLHRRDETTAQHTNHRVEKASLGHDFGKPLRALLLYVQLGRWH